MKIIELSFATITLLDVCVAEVCVDQGVEIDMPRVEEFHAALQGVFSDCFGLLVVKKNSYSYGPKAMMKIASLGNLRAIAVVNYNSARLAATKTLKLMPANREKNIKNFDRRGSALAWLKRELKH